MRLFSAENSIPGSAIRRRGHASSYHVTPVSGEEELVEKLVVDALYICRGELDPKALPAAA
jgi:hypothetical protein